jgi:hypothetical protein
MIPSCSPFRSWDSPAGWGTEVFAPRQCHSPPPNLSSDPDLSVELSIGDNPSPECSTPKVAAKSFAWYPSPETTNKTFGGFRPISPITGRSRKLGDLFQPISKQEEENITAGIRSTRVTEYPGGLDDRFARSQHNRYPSPLQSPLRPCFDDSDNETIVLPKKKQVHTPKIADEVTNCECQPIETVSEFRVYAGKNREIETDERSRKFRVDFGIAIFSIGDKSWRVSIGGEFYVPRGEKAVLSSVIDGNVIVTELSV